MDGVEPAGSGGRPEPEPAPELVELALASVELSAEGLQPATGTVSLLSLIHI